MDNEMGEELSEFWAAEMGMPYENKPNAILEKSFAFSIRVIKLYK